MRHKLLQQLMEAMIKENKAVVGELKEELKDFLVNSEEFDGLEFAYELIDAMYKWSDELKKARRFKNALLDFMEDELQQIYGYIENRLEYVQDDIDRVYRFCKRYGD